MNAQRDIDLVNELLANNGELAWLEFKKDNDNPEMIGKCCSALANGARIEGKDFGYILWGVVDVSHQIVGTSFNPNTKKVSNQEFHFWLVQHLKPSVAFTFREIDHPGGRVVLLEIPAATSAPVAFDNIA